MSDSFIDTQLCLKISDPWELGEAVKWKAFQCHCLVQQGSQLLVQLTEPITFKNHKCEYFVATPRHEGSTVGQLFSGKPLFCGLSEVAPDIANSDTPFDSSKWRGGIAIIGELSLAEG